MPRKLLRQQKNKRRLYNNSIKRPIVILVLLFIAVAAIRPFLRFDNLLRMAIAVDGREQVKVIIADFRLGEINTVYIPGNTEVEVSRALGRFKLANVWPLGENEKIGGRLLAETLVKNFHIPVSAWLPESLEGVDSGELKPVLKLATIGRSTNLTVTERIRLILFFLRAKSLEKTDYDLTQTTALKGVKLKDGSVGYLVSGPVPQKISVLFADEYLVSHNAKVFIRNQSSDSRLSTKLGEIVETLGGKVVSADNQQPSDEDCTVYANNKKLASIFIEIFGCSFNSEASKEGEIKLQVGERFMKRF